MGVGDVVWKPLGTRTDPGSGGNGVADDLARPTGVRRPRRGRRDVHRRGPRRAAVLLVVAVVASVLSIPAVVTSNAEQAAAADVPVCPPGVTSATANCIPAPQNSGDVDVPPTPDLGPQQPSVPNGWVEQSFTATRMSIGENCPWPSTPFSALPCNAPGISVGAVVYDPNGTTAQSLGTWIIVGAAGDGCDRWATSCAYRIRYNPSFIDGARTLIVTVGSSILGDLNGDGNIFDTFSYSFSVTINGTATVTPTADFSVGPVTAPGERVFTAASTTPDGGPLSHQWDFGDGGSASGAFVTHTYTRPGTYQVKITSTNLQGRSASVTKPVTVAAPTLGLSIDLLDGAAPPLTPERPVRLQVTVSASADGVGALTGVRFTDGALLKVTPEDAFLIAEGPTPPLPTGGFSIEPGAERTFDVTIEPQLVGRYDLLSQVTGTDGTGRVQTADASSPGEVGQALTVGIELDPPEAAMEEGPDGPEPIDVTATITFTNTTGVAMDEVTMTSLRVDRTVVGQLLAVEQTGGADPGEDGLAIGSLAPGETKEVTATFRATDDAEVEFTAQATASLADGRTEIGVGRERWSVTPKYLLGVTSRVTNPPTGTLLPAGELVRITGTVKNLSTTATLEIGPMYPTLTGNAGAMSMAWGPDPGDPTDPQPTGNLTLEPGESRDFSVRFLTTWSDPRGIEGTNHSGGTFATATFTPWGEATLEDGTKVDITPAKVRATEADLSHRVSIDDSIEIPPFEFLPWAGAVTIGAIQGVLSATAAVISSTIDLIKLPYTVVVAASEFQSQVWDSFTDSEKQDFVNDTGLMVAAVLARNAEFGKEGAAALWQKAKDATLLHMTEMANNWEVGDYTETTRLWAKYSTDAVAQAVIPVALAKMAKSPRAIAALTRVQEALQSRMAPVLADGALATKIEQLGPILNALESGTELLPEQLATLYGITPEELAELQKLAEQFDILMTVRSRHASSIEWIERFQAMLKPETLKIKTVSELDAKLGYRASDIGSLVFRKPEPLRAFDAGQGDLGALIDEFVQSKGFVQGTGEWENAVNRVVARSAEWRKWEKYYKRWDDQGWIDVSFNYEGNAITDPIKKGKSSLGVAPLESGKYVGFQMRPVGQDEYVLEMMNNKVGRFVPVTGDIDPISFTHLDGSPLTMEEHAALLDAMARNTLLQAQHGESATFVKGGVNFIVGQFKPNEPGLQIAPGGHLPRVVRLNADKSRWASAEDYHLHWDGGFVYSGSYIPKGAIPRPAVVPPPVTEPLPMRPRALPRATTAEPNVGRCRITFSATKEAAAAVLDVKGKITTLGGDGKSTQPSPLHDQCFTPGPPVEVQVKPVTGLSESAPVGATELEIPEGDPWLASAGEGLQVGDQVTIGAGTPDAVTHTIIGFGSIIIDAPLERAAEEGELIVVTKAAEPTTTTTTVPATTVPSTTAPPTTAPSTTAAPTPTTAAPSSGVPASVSGASATRSSGTSGSGSSTSGGSELAFTGSGAADGLALELGAGLLVIGLLFIAVSARRPRPERGPR